VGANGGKIKMAAQGPFRFSAYCERGDEKWIEAYSVREGGCTILMLTEREGAILPGSYIPAPYRIGSRLTGNAKARIEGRKKGKKKKITFVDADEISPVESSGKPEKRDRREARKRSAIKRAAGSRRSAIESVLSGLAPIAPEVQ
jgi:hypothetical protein